MDMFGKEHDRMTVSEYLALKIENPDGWAWEKDFMAECGGEAAYIETLRELLSDSDPVGYLVDGEPMYSFALLEWAGHQLELEYEKDPIGDAELESEISTKH